MFHSATMFSSSKQFENKTLCGSRFVIGISVPTAKMWTKREAQLQGSLYAIFLDRSIELLHLIKEKKKQPKSVATRYRLWCA
jgi:hypothetical protein